jgi:hypothetical protein
MFRPPEIDMDAATHAEYQLRFRSLFHEGRGYAFSCDRNGHVDMDAMSERSLLNYLYARTVVGREFAHPAVEAAGLH